MKALALEFGFEWPYLYDEAQETAKAYFAACTPDFMLFDDALACVYRGQFDDARPKTNNPSPEQTWPKPWNTSWKEAKSPRSKNRA